MSDVIEILKGDDADITVILQSKATKKAKDLSTGVERIKACFTKQTGSTPLNLFHLPRASIATVNGDDIITLDTTDILEGAPVVAAGIPAGAYVIKTPSSTTSPTAAGTVQISEDATATATVAGYVGNIEISDDVNGEIKIHMHEIDTTQLKTSLDSKGVETLMSWEVETLISGVTKTVQFLKSLRVIARTC